jgi:AcrR family transcriptional regulator
MAIDDIAARVGISKGTVYLHFASKEDLVLALFERGLRAFVQTLGATLDTPAAPREKLRLIFERVHGAMLSARRFQLFHAVFHDPALREQMAQRHETLRALWAEPTRRIAALIDEGKACGDFDATIPTPVLQSLFASLLTPHVYRQLVAEQGMPLEEVVAHLRRFFFKGIAAGAGPGPMMGNHPGAGLPGRDRETPPGADVPGYGTEMHSGAEAPGHGDAD